MLKTENGYHLPKIREPNNLAIYPVGYHLTQVTINEALNSLSLLGGSAGRKTRYDSDKQLTRLIGQVSDLKGFLNLDNGGYLAQNLNSLYSYLTERLLEVRSSSAKASLVEIDNLLREIRMATSAMPLDVYR